MVVEDGGGVEAPAGLADLGGGVWPAVADDLVGSNEEVKVGFGFHIERSGAEDGGMEPCESLGGGDVVAEDVVGGGGPAEGIEGSPAGSFAFGESHEALAGEANCWFSIGLRAELGVMGGGPGVDLGEIVFVHEFSQGAAVVVSHFFGCGGASGGEFGE